MELTPSSAGKFLDPEAIIAQIELNPGSMVADFGCGPGYFSLPFATTVGQEGKVFSLDVLPQALEAVESNAKKEGLLNIITKRVNLENEKGSQLEAGMFDWVIMKDVLFQNQKKESMVGEAYRILKDGGRILVIEWDKQESTIGPAQEMRIAKSELERMFLDQKFETEKAVSAGGFHYAFVFRKK